MASIGVKRRDAPDVDVENVEWRLAVDDPFGDQPAGAAGVCDAGRIETGANEIAVELGRFAENEIAIEREALRSVQQQLDLRRLEARRAVERILHQDFEVIPILRQQLELEAIGNPLDVPWLCDRLETAHH